MQRIFDLLARWIGIGRAFRILFNLFPGFRSTGARVIAASDDYRYAKIRLPLTRKNRNYVGTIYGGSLYACVDGIPMVQLINILGDNYVVWDKSATIRFRRPATRTLYAEMCWTDELIEQIRNEIAAEKENDYTITITLQDEDGTVYAEVDKVLYVADKAYYKAKRRRRQQQAA